MTSSKSLCATCHKAVSIFTCRGCTNEYCMRHAHEHRQVLGQQMDEIILQHDEILQIILDQKKEEFNSHHPLIKQVNQWEKESIEKIHQIAEDTRQKLFNIINKDINKLTDDIKNLTEELNNAHIDDNYVETDLNLWIDKLRIIKNNLFQQQMINIQSNTQQIPLIFNISINEGPKDIFEKFLGDIQIEDNNQVIIHGQTTNYASVRCRNEYSLNEHRFQFKIEQLDQGKWFFLGIISKNIDLQLNPLQTRTSYGWSTYNNISLNGIIHLRYNQYKTDFEINDILELIIDCNRKIIRLINQRTKNINEIYVDIYKCPFPWQIHLGLYFKDDRIRILST